MNLAIYISLWLLIAICLLLAIAMTFYLGREKCKRIDRLVHGFEIPGDNIFAQILRLPNYGWAFSSPWFAKRSHLTQIRNHFDKKFERPFIITHYLFMVGGLSMVLLFVLDKFFLHVVEY